MRQLYLDCDGVLADFDAGAEKVLGLKPRAFEQRHNIGSPVRMIGSRCRTASNNSRAPGIIGSVP